MTVPHYLGGELLFAPNSRSLAVTTLLNTGRQQNEIVNLTPGGKLTTLSASLARIDVGSARNRTTLSLYDPFKRESIGQFFLNLRDTTPLYACESSEVDTLDACNIGGSDSYIVLK